MGVVVGQHAEIEKAQRPLRDLWLPLRSSDRLVVEYRRWLDRFGADLPFYRGFATAKNSSVGLEVSQGRQALHGLKDRHHLHTQVCATCNRLNRRLDRVITSLWVLVAGCAALATLTIHPVFTVAALLLIVAIVALGRLQSKL